MSTPIDPGGLLDMSVFTQTDPDGAVPPGILTTIQHALVDAPVPDLPDGGWTPYVEEAVAGGGDFDPAFYEIDPDALVPSVHEPDDHVLEEMAPQDDIISNDDPHHAETEEQVHGGSDVHDDPTTDHPTDEFGWDDPGHG
jgi:hypothetical protein